MRAEASPLPPTAPINRLRRLAQALALVAVAPDCPPELAEDAKWFSRAAHAYQEGVATGLTLDQATDLRPASNAPSWPTLERRARRDDLLRQYEQSACVTLSRNATAAKILADIRRVERARSPVNGPDALLAEALRTGERMPSTKRGICDALEARTPLQTSNGSEENRGD